MEAAPIVECVPNISDGRNPEVYTAVADAAARVPGVRLLDVDPGADTNRTVITFAGAPAAVVQAAVAVARKATELIDMRGHSGAHPRMGAVDVVPFVPVRGIDLAGCAALAREAGARIGTELGMPVYLYEYAATSEDRRSLSDIRAGEYEALAGKLGTAQWQPDFGPNEWSAATARTGAVAVGARRFLIAYNINFNTQSVKLVNDIALTIREKGRIARTPEGKFVRDEKGEPVYAPGLFGSCKAMGWHIPEYGLAQLTMNLTDWEATPPHLVFDAVCDLAAERGLRVTGSELVGLIPLAALREAGRFFLGRQRGVCTGVPEAELVRVAAQSLGLSELRPFDPRRQVVEYALEGTAEQAAAARPLVHSTIRGFADELASASPAPGGGSVAALCGALAAGLAAMVPCLTVGKRGYKAVEDEMQALAAEAQEHKDALLAAMDDDTAAFNALLASFRLPADTDDAAAAKQAAVAAATRGTIEVPLSVLARMPRVIELLLACAQRGNRNTLSDALAGAVCALACAEGAHANVLINLKGLERDDPLHALRLEADELLAASRMYAGDVIGSVRPRLEPEYDA